MKVIFPPLLILLCLLPISQTAIATDNMIIDLDSTDVTEFSSQAATWTLSNAVCSTCSHSYTTPTYCWTGTTYQVLGGPNALGPSGSSAVNQYYEKEYPPLAEFPTYAVLVFDVYLFADALGLSADMNGILDPYINGIKYSTRAVSSQICTQNYVDSQGVSIQTVVGFPGVKFRFDLSSISASQNGNGVTLKFVNLLDYLTTKRSFGIKNLKLYMFRNASQYSDSVNFPCGFSFFWDNTQGCVPCAPYCKLCTGPSSSECTSCNLPYYFYPNGTCMATCVNPFTPTTTSTAYTCNKKCANANQPYLLEYSGQCSGSCNSPLVSSYDGLCSVPCPSAQYLHPDGSCQTDCLAPLQAGTWAGLVKTCTVCTKYIYSNNSCLATCPAPLLSKTGADGVKSCYNPCAGINNYLYPDSSCIVNCPFPFITASGVDGQYCKSPCANDYIYPDYTSCLSECESPLKPVGVAGILLCMNPCSGYLYPDNSCLAACDSSMEIKTTAGVKYCQNSCSGYVYPDNSCFSECDFPLVSDQVGFIKYCKSSCTDANDYLYPDNSCFANCEIPLIAEETGGIQFCKNLCSGYLYPDNSCLVACVAPLLSETTAGVPYCRNPCSDANNYLYPDDSCFGECASPLVDDQMGGIKYCKTSCPNTNDYLYPDDSCLGECAPPFEDDNVRGILYCENHCNDYTYPDGSCLTKCESPLIVENKAFVKYCKNPCSNVDDYVYADGSCDETCLMLFPEKTEHDIKYCYNPCKDSDTYLASNKLCQATCPSPSTIKTESIAEFCVFPCENLNFYYYENTGDCQATCESPNTPVESPLPKICKAPPETPSTPGEGEDPEPSSPSKEEDLDDESVEKITKTANIVHTVLSSGTFAFMIWTPIDSTLSFVGPFTKMLHYIKYMKIDYPEKVLLMFKEQKDYFQDFPNKMAPDMLNEFPEHQLPEKFELYNTPSSFFVNFWSASFKLSVILFVTCVILLIAQQRRKPVDGTLKILVEGLKWNLFLIFFCCNIIDVVLYTALEMRTLHLDNAAAVVSFLWCLAANAGSLYVVYKILDITWVLQKLKKKVTPLQEKKKVTEPWANCQTLFAPYQDRWYYQHIFLFIFLVRVCLFGGMLGYLFDYPGFQASSFVVLNILMLVFLIVKRPIKDRVSLIMMIIFEIILLPLNISLLILAIMDEREIENLDQRNRLGDVIIYTSLIAPFIAIAMLIIKVFFIYQDFYKANEGKKKFNAKAIYPEVALDATQEMFPNNTTRILRSSSIYNKNLLGSSQKIDDLDEEPSPTPSPNRSLLSQNRLQRISVIVEKSNPNFLGNSQKIDDLDEEPSPAPSPDRSLLSNNRLQPVSVIVGKSNSNLLGSSQGIDDVGEKPSPAPSPDKSFRFQRTSVIVEKSRLARARFCSTLVLPDHMATSSPEVSPTRDSASHIRDSKSITPFVLPDHMATSIPEVSPTRDSASHTRNSVSHSSTSITPSDNARRHSPTRDLASHTRGSVSHSSMSITRSDITRRRFFTRLQRSGITRDQHFLNF